MGVRFPSVASTTFVGPLPASAAETVVLISPPLTLPLDFSQVIILAMAQILAGTGVTSHTWRIRRGTTTAGVQVNVSAWTNQATAATNSTSTFAYVDTPGAVAGQQYCLTVIQNGATAAGTFSDGSLIAFAL